MNLNAILFAIAVWFALLIAFAAKFIWPPLTNAMDERRKKIADGLAEAEKGKTALAEGEKAKAAMLREARDQATEMKALNDKQAQAQIDAAKAQAKTEADRIIAAAHARSEEHTSELQSHSDLVCRLLLEKKNTNRFFRCPEPSGIIASTRIAVLEAITYAQP